MHPVAYLLSLLCCCLFSACAPLQAPLWRPDTAVYVESTQKHVENMVELCETGAYTGQMLSELPSSSNALCQPQDKGGKLCAVLVSYPEKRVYSYLDGRSYAAIVQSSAWFNIVVDEQDRVLQCKAKQY